MRKRVQKQYTAYQIVRQDRHESVGPKPVVVKWVEWQWRFVHHHRGVIVVTKWSDPRASKAECLKEIRLLRLHGKTRKVHSFRP